MLGWRRASFGDYVRAEVTRRKLAGTRDELQSVGTELLNADTERFCRSVVEMSGWKPGEGLILDGFRHVQTIDPLVRFTRHLPFKIILIKVDEETRRERLSRRGEGDPRVIKRIEAHSSEAQVASTIEEIADLILDGAEPPNTLAEKVSSWVRQASNAFES